MLQEIYCGLSVFVPVNTNTGYRFHNTGANTMDRDRDGSIRRLQAQDTTLFGFTMSNTPGPSLTFLSEGHLNRAVGTEPTVSGNRGRALEFEVQQAMMDENVGKPPNEHMVPVDLLGESDDMQILHEAS